MPLGEAMFTQRATRRLDPNRAIPEEAIKLLLDAASKAPNGGNAQPARYLVVNDREKIREFGPLYHEAWWAKRRDGYGWKDKHDIPAGSPYRMPALLADEMGNAPMVVLAFSTGSPGEAMSVLPGVQGPSAAWHLRGRFSPHYYPSSTRGAGVLDCLSSSW